MRHEDAGDLLQLERANGAVVLGLEKEMESPQAGNRGWAGNFAKPRTCNAGNQIANHGLGPG